MTIMEWIFDNVSWVFSGIGVAVIGIVFSLLSSKKNKSKSNNNEVVANRTVNIKANSTSSGEATVDTGDIVLGDKYAPPNETVLLLKEARKELDTIDTSMLAEIYIPGSDVLAAFNRFLPGAGRALQIYDRIRPFMDEQRLARLDVYVKAHREFQEEVLLNAEKYETEIFSGTKEPAAEMLIRNVGNLWQFIEAQKKELSGQIHQQI